MSNKLELTGQKFGRLTVISEAQQRKGKYPEWRCICDCGNECIVVGHCLTSGNTKSCGCLRFDNLRKKVKKHDGKGTRLYRIWKNMRSRCRNKNTPQYKDYGGRGISICSEWDNFLVFKSWARANGYDDSLTIDRINNDGNYCPENCRWVTHKEQNNHRRSNRIINGKTLAEWARISGINYNTLLSRLKKMSLSEAINNSSRQSPPG